MRPLFIAFLAMLLASCVQDSKGKRNRITPNLTAATETPTPVPTPEVRPDKDILINRTYCACDADGLQIIEGNCQNFCANSGDTFDTLHLTFSPGTETLLNDFTVPNSNPTQIFKLENTQNWCTQEIDDGNTGVACQVIATDGAQTINLAPTFPSVNAVNVNIGQLTPGRVWLITLRETTSGSETDTIQIYRPPARPLKVANPLFLRPVSEYACITRRGTPGVLNQAGNPPGHLFDFAARLHFYFPSGETPPRLPPTNNGFVICHDAEAENTTTDSEQFPRIELQDNIFTLWNPNDPRLTPSDVNNPSSTLLINQEIENRLDAEFGQGATINLFSFIQWPNVPVLSDGSNTPVATPILGVIMQAFVDQNTNLAFCPGHEQFESGQPLFTILREYIPNTEGLFLAIKEPEAFIDTNGVQSLLPNDFVLIRESLLDKIAFFFDSGTPTKPDDITFQNKTIQFYWPPNVGSPLTRQSQQKLYTVDHPSRINVDNGSGNVFAGNIPSDKRFACIPVRGGTDD